MLIYEPSGRAQEYSPLALNIYTGCDHRCEYCYAPLAMKKTREQHAAATLRKALDFRQLKKEAAAMKQAKDQRQILLCFTCDPYQKLDEVHKHTRSVLEILLAKDLNVAILTKGGRRSARDFDIMAANKDKIKYGATLVFTDDAEALKKEPGAAPTSERIKMLKAAHELGIKTWVSLEPVYHPQDACELILETKDFVDIYKVGKLNYRPEADNVNWKDFAVKVQAVLAGLKKDFYIKNDLKKYLNKIGVQEEDKALADD